MKKEELKNIVSEIFGNSSDSAFDLFIKKIASSIKGNQALLLNGIGYFQLKKEPLSRMERKEEGSVSGKEILLFLPAGEIDEENIITFEIDTKSKTSTEFSDSVFNLGIKQPNIILDQDSEVTEEANSIEEESIQNSITEFVGSGEVVEGYQLFNGIESNVNPILEDDGIDSGELNTDDKKMMDSSDDLSESEINETTPIDKVEDGIVEENDDVNEIKIDDEYDVTYSSIEQEITAEDVNAVGPEVLKFDDEEEIDSEFEAEIEAKIKNAELEPKVEEKNKTELETEITAENNLGLETDIEQLNNTGFETEIELENNIGLETKIEKEISTEFKTENNDATLEEANPFDELNGYIKNETIDDIKDETINDIQDKAINIIENEPEIFEEVSEELQNDYPAMTYSEFESKSNAWYKNPILYISIFGLIVAFVVVYLFFPIKSLILGDDEANVFSVDDKDLTVLIDSASTNNKTSKNIVPTGTSDVNSEVSEKKVIEKKVVKPKVTTLTGLYREINNDQSITKRIYFDGERYTVQSSSWKSTSIAEREVGKLKKRGFDAFIFKVFIPSKNATWNRVRIGYFKSKREAEEFLRKNKI